MSTADRVVLDVDGVDVSITHPGRVVFADLGVTKLDLVRYYLDLAAPVLDGVAGRPMILKRFTRGIAAEAFFQKQAPDSRPAWVDVVELRYASGHTVQEVVVRDAPGLAWVVNLGCIDLNPHPVRAEDLAHPDELRIDLDPVPGVQWPQVLEVAMLVREVLADHGVVGWPKTSGSRGFHVYAALEPGWTYRDVRLAAHAVAREAERREPGLATARWWKEERQGVFIDFNQNAYDRTVASAYSVRPTPDARVSTPLTWAQVPICRPAQHTVRTVPDRVAAEGDPWAGMRAAPASIGALLDLGEQLGPAPRAPKGTGRRVATMPVIEIARAPTQAQAQEGLARWKARHPVAAAALHEADVLVDRMRGRSSLWYRIRVNLQHVAEADRPPQEPLEVDYDPWGG
jgi:DNA ligase D-like protein (predicted polymerase)